MDGNHCNLLMAAATAAALHQKEVDESKAEAAAAVATEEMDLEEETAKVEAAASLRALAARPVILGERINSNTE